MICNMSLAAPHPLPPRAAYTDELIFRLTVDQYHELIRAGKLTDEDPVELVEGILLYKIARNTPHSTATRLCRRAIEILLPDGWFYDSQEPITLPDGEPEPDGIIVRGRIEDYTDRHPAPADIALVIEVADSSLPRDMGIKLRSYARAKVSNYWVIDVDNRVALAMSDPDASVAESANFRARRQLGPEGVLSLTLDGKVVGEIAVAALLPPAGSSA